METLSRRLNDDYLRMKKWKRKRLHEGWPMRRVDRLFSTKGAVFALSRAQAREREREREGMELAQARQRGATEEGPAARERRTPAGAEEAPGGTEPGVSPGSAMEQLAPVDEKEKEKARMGAASGLVPRARSPIGQAGRPQGSPQRPRSSA